MRITYTAVTNPVYANSAQTLILCTVQFGHIAPPVPFVASSQDTEPHGRQIFADCVAGKYGPVGPYVAPVAPILTAAQQAAGVVAAAAALTFSLVTYASNKRDAISVGGVTVNLGSAKNPVNVSVDTSALGLAQLNSLVQQGNAAPTQSFTWYQSSGNLTMPGSQMANVLAAVNTWLASIMAIWSSAVAAINATPPTITTTAQIDSLAWPANS